MKETILRIEEEFKNYWKMVGFLEFSPISITSPPKDCGVFFVSSGFFHHLKRIEEEGCLSHSFVGVQPCIKFGFKNLTLSEMKERDGYFTFFRQLSCAIKSSFSINQLIERVWYYLTEISNLEKEKLYMVVDSHDTEIKNIWKKVGVKTKNIALLDNYVMNFSIPALDLNARYYPFVYDRGESYVFSCGKKDCNIGCSCGRFLELGDIGIIQTKKSLIFDHGIGLERILSVRLGLEKVSDIYSELSNLIKHHFSISQDHSIILSDYFRSLLVLTNEGLTPKNKGKGHCLRIILRKIFDVVPCKKINEHSLRFVLQKTAESIEEIDLSGSIQITTEEMLTEYIKYQRLLRSGKSILKKFFHKNNRKKLTENEKNYFYQTHGLSYDIIDKIVSEL